jgi:hypothetical protein
MTHSSTFPPRHLLHPAHLLIAATILVGSLLTLEPQLKGILQAQAAPQNDYKISVKLYQKWTLQPGDRIAGKNISGGLGDLSIELGGASVRAPFPGKVRRDDQGYLFLSSPTTPGYLFRLRGLAGAKLGNLQAGDRFGHGQLLHFATLKQQSNGTWAVVEPAKQVLEAMLKEG